MRKFLRIPSGGIYQKIVDSPYEWSVVTDTQLRILGVERGGVDHISEYTIMGGLHDVASRLPKNKISEVFVLHSHPTMYYGGPSQADLRVYTKARKNGFRLFSDDYPNLHIKAFGQISKRGIMLITLPESNAKLEEVREKLEYSHNLPNRGDNRMRRINYETYKKSAVSPEQLTQSEKKIISRVNNEEFRNIAKEIKNMGVKQITRNRAGRSQRRRGR